MWTRNSFVSQIGLLTSGGEVTLVQDMAKTAIVSDHASEPCPQGFKTIIPYEQNPATPLVFSNQNVLLNNSGPDYVPSLPRIYSHFSK